MKYPETLIEFPFAKVTQINKTTVQVKVRHIEIPLPFVSKHIKRSITNYKSDVCKEDDSLKELTFEISGDYENKFKYIRRLTRELFGLHDHLENYQNTKKELFNRLDLFRRDVGVDIELNISDTAATSIFLIGEEEETLLYIGKSENPSMSFNLVFDNNKVTVNVIGIADYLANPDSKVEHINITLNPTDLHKFDIPYMAGLFKMSIRQLSFNYKNFCNISNEELSNDILFTY